MKKTKILYYALTFYPERTGYANAFLNFIGSVSKHLDDIQIDVVTPAQLNSSEELEINNVNIIRLKKCNLKIKKIGRFLNEYCIYKSIKKLYQNEHYDHVFIETFDHAMLVYQLSNLIDTHKLFIRVHATSETEYAFYFPGVINKIRKYFIKKASNNIINFVSTNTFHVDFIKKYFLSNDLYQILNKNFFILPNTLDESTLKTIPINNKNNKKIQIFTLGRMDLSGYLQKGFQDLLYALVLMDKVLIDNIELTIVGSGNYQYKLKDFAEKNELNFITFVEKMQHIDILKKLSDSDIVILPSRIEGLSMFALEALGTNNAVIFSDAGGLKDLVFNNGYLFESQNIEDLALKISNLLKLNKEELEKMKVESYKLYKQNFSQKHIATKLNSISKILRSN